VIGAVRRTKPSGIVFYCGTPAQEHDGIFDAPLNSAISASRSVQLFCRDDDQQRLMLEAVCVATGCI